MNKIKNLIIIALFTYVVEIFGLYMNFYLAFKDVGDWAPIFWCINAALVLFLINLYKNRLRRLFCKEHVISLFLLIGSTFPFVLYFSQTLFALIIAAILFAIFLSIVFLFLQKAFSESFSENPVINVTAKIVAIIAPLIVATCLTMWHSYDLEVLFLTTAAINVILSIFLFDYKVPKITIDVSVRNYITTMRFKRTSMTIFLFFTYGVYTYLIKTFGAGQFAQALGDFVYVQPLYGIKSALIVICEILIVIVLSKYVSRRFSKYLIPIGMICLTLKILGYSTGVTPGFMIGIEVLSAVGIAFIILGINEMYFSQDGNLIPSTIILFTIGYSATFLFNLVLMWFQIDTTALYFFGMIIMTVAIIFYFVDMFNILQRLHHSGTHNKERLDLHE